MRVAVMQPYFFPYLGYFQLLAAADAFVVYDDVNYIKGGWINRNFILGADGGRERITLQTQGASQNRLIREVGVGQNRGKLLRTIGRRYARAPQAAAVMPLLVRILESGEENLARFLDFQLRQICNFLGLKTLWRVSSEMAVATDLRGHDRVIAICEHLGATMYINAAGGRELYPHAAFERAGLELRFLESTPSEYTQFGRPFVPALSVIDMLMFNDVPACRSLLEECRLVR